MSPTAEVAALPPPIEETNEFRVFGPPGTGKTTYLGKQITNAVEKYGAENIMVTSFSRAAAAELTGRKLPIPKEQVGTLHAHCFRALCRPVIAESKVAEWNDENEQFAVSGGSESNLDDPAEEIMARKGCDGDKLLAECSRNRNLCIPVELWKLSLQRFYAKWRAWKDRNGYMDFTDLLEVAARDIKRAPGAPAVIFADEAQDFTRLQLKIVRQWGVHTEFFVVVGDDDQTIYGFTGATPDAFLTPEVAPNHKITLSQSYRVPRAVHGLATRWINCVVGREPKEYRPRDADGEVRYCDNPRGSNIMDPRHLIDDAERRIAHGQTCMFLTTCSYMLSAVRAQLIERGLPFWNPYRRKRGDWNPLGGGGKGVSAAQRVVAFLKPHIINGESAPPWTALDFKKFADWMRVTKTFRRGAKAEFDALADDMVISQEHLESWLEPARLDELAGLMWGPVEPYLNWWASRTNDEHKKTAAYPCKVVIARGVTALREPPKITIGTIHSVKGGQADCVYLFPDLSLAGDAEWNSGIAERYDGIFRQFYVGMTRARETLVICAPASTNKVVLG